MFDSTSTAVPPLKVHRIAAGLTQRQLAAAAGVSRESISNVERGATAPAARTAAAIAAALGVSVEQLWPEARDA